jgi:hypothetical protein
MYALFDLRTRIDLHIGWGVGASQSDDPLELGVGPYELGAITRALGRV